MKTMKNMKDAKDPIPKYKCRDWAIVLPEVWIFNSEDRDIPFQITRCYIEENARYETYPAASRIRYQINHSWFNEDEIRIITRETDPEYFL